MEENITAYVTAYALSKGIIEAIGKVNHNISSAMFSYGRYGNAHGKDWHRTKEDAIARAENMRTQKIASLKKQIEKLEKMNIKVIKDK